MTLHVFAQNERAYQFYCRQGFSVVEQNFQSQGIGKALVHYIQQNHSALTLHVFAQNERAYQFYCRQGFSVVEQNIDPQTNLLEYSMQWKTKNAFFLSCH